MEAEKQKIFDKGKFVISLDFELMWGVRDKKSIEQYGENILGVRKAIPAMLELFDKYGVKSTFSTVGFLFARNREELICFLPPVRPVYQDFNLSPYPAIAKIGFNEEDDPYHFGYSLLERIISNGNHEIGTHTFCHYYCLEPGQTTEDFRNDLAAAKKIAAASQVNVRSLVFPRNQFNQSYLQVCKDTGIDSYRGNPVSWLYAGRNKEDESLFRRALRFLDTYLNITGHHCYTKEYVSASVITNVAGSRFLRPYSKKLSILDPLRMRRIKRAMLHAAKEHKLYHLWWHPHNFGVNLEENLRFLEGILQYYSTLSHRFGFESVTMSGLADQMKTQS